MGKKERKEQENDSPEPTDVKQTSSAVGQSVTLSAKRSCTDVACCLLFTLCVLGMIAVGLFGYIQGDPNVLFAPVDSDGQLCGYGNKSEDRVLFFFDLLKCRLSLTEGATCDTPQVCLSGCPSKSWTWKQLHINETNSGSLSIKENRKDMICKPGVAARDSNKTVEDLVRDEDCAAYYVKSTAVLNRCLPPISPNEIALDPSSPLQGQVSNITGSSRFMREVIKMLGNGLNDVINSKWYIATALIGSMVLSMIWILLLKWIAGIIVWVIMLCFTGLLSYACYYGFTTYVKMKNELPAEGNFFYFFDISYYLGAENAWLALSCISAVTLVMVILVLIFLRNRIQVAVALLKEAGRATRAMVFVLLWPITQFILQVCTLAFWSTSALYLLSISRNLKISESSLNFTTRNYPLVGTILDFSVNYSTYLQIFIIVITFWCVNFIVALGRVTIGGSFACFYWSTDKSKMPAFPVASSASRAIRYHIGTMAFGSLVLTIIQIIRIILQLLEAKLKASRNGFAVFIVKCLKCCFWCLDKLIKKINDNVYIMVSIYGKNFCTSAREAFSLLSRNILRLSIVDSITDFVLFVGKIGVVGATGLTAYFFFDGKIPFTEGFIKDLNLTYSAIPIAIIAVFSYIVASGFFNVYSSGVDTLFICFLSDLDQNDGSVEKPYRMNSRLMKIFGKKNDDYTASETDLPGQEMKMSKGN